MSSGSRSPDNALAALFYDIDATLAQLAHVARPQAENKRPTVSQGSTRAVERPAKVTVADLRHLVAMSPSGRRNFNGLTFVVAELAVKDPNASPYAPRHIAPYLFLEVPAPKRFSPNNVDLVRLEPLRQSFSTGSSQPRIGGPKHRTPTPAEKEAVREVLESAHELFAPGEQRALLPPVDLRSKTAAPAAGVASMTPSGRSRSNDSFGR